MAANLKALATRHDADIVVLAMGLEANPLVHKMGLPAHSRSGLRINAKLHSMHLT